MRVDSNRPVRAPATRRDAKSGAGLVGGFAEALDDAGPAGAPAPAVPVSGAGALFALQEVPDATAQRRKAVARASQMLDRLDDIQLGLIDGAIDRRSLSDLAAAARSARSDTGDPALQGVLDEIELRAAVELAKLSSVP